MSKKAANYGIAVSVVAVIIVAFIGGFYFSGERITGAVVGSGIATDATDVGAIWTLSATAGSTINIRQTMAYTGTISERLIKEDRPSDISDSSLIIRRESAARVISEFWLFSERLFSVLSKFSEIADSS